MNELSRWLLWIAGLPLLLCCVSTEKPPGYEAAARAARLNAESPAASQYQAAVGRRLQNPVERAARACSVRIPDTRGARILYRLDASGAPIQTLIYPDSEFGQCVHAAIRDVPLLPPPESDYWIAVDAHYRWSRPLRAGAR